MSEQRIQEQPEANADREHSSSLLLVEGEAGSRVRLRRILEAEGFAVTSVSGMEAALAAAAEMRFAYAVTELRLLDGNGIALIKKLHGLHTATRIVVLTGSSSFATVILTLRAGAADYLSKPVIEAEMLAALLGQPLPLPSVPETPLGVERVCWEHVQRVFEQCGRNVTETARRLCMHRRSLQRILGKNAPLPRAIQLP